MCRPLRIGSVAFYYRQCGVDIKLVVAAGLLLWLGPQLDSENVTKIQDPTVSLVAKVAGANIILILFNMIPTFPMD